MTTVQFRDLRANDIATQFTTEELFRRYGAYSGIHDFKFNTLLEVPTLTVVGATPSQWNYGSLYTGLPSNFIVKYHKTDYRQGVIIVAGAGTGIFLVGTDSSGYPEIRYSNSVIAQTIPKETPLEADVTLVFRQQTFSDLEDALVWQSVSMYMNDQWITTFNSKTSIIGTDMQIGFMAYGTDSITYTDIQVPELCNTTDTTNLGAMDPGENPISGLQRNIDGLYINYFMRFDGSMRVWKKRQRDSVMTISGDLEGVKRSYNLPYLITHARMMGAYIWAEAIDEDLMREYGHRPREVDNSYLMTVEECHDEAINEIKRSQEATFTFVTQARHIPILEPEDRVTIDGDDWVINDYSISASPGRLVQTYNCRRYVWA